MTAFKAIPALLILLCCSQARASAGTVVGWGNNSYGQLNIPGDLTNAAAIAAGNSHNVALKSDGSVVAWGSNDSGQATVPADLSNVVAVAAGGNISLALKSDGSVVGWGSAPAGLATLSNIIAVTCGSSHMLALRSDRTVAALGDNSQNQCNVPVGLNNVVAIGAGTRFSCALTSDGNVVTWGSSTGNGELNAPQTGRGVNIVAANAHGLVLTAEGVIYPWGDSVVSGYGSYSIFPPLWYPGAGTGDAAVIGNGSVHFLAASVNGSPIAWGYNGNHQADIPPGVSNVVAITGGDYHSIALMSDGSPQLANRHLGLSLLPTNTIASSETVTFHVAAAGMAPLTYYWLWNDSNFLTTASPKLDLTNVQPAQAGIYSVIVSNSLGVLQGSNQVLSVLPLKVNGQPADQNVFEAADVTFTVTAVGTDLNYRWRFNNVDLPDETNAVLNLPVVATSQAGHYSVVVSNLYGFFLSSNAQLTVSLPAITNHPVDRVANAGDTLSFTVSAAGAALSYQWLFNGTNLPGATSAVLTLSDVTAAAAGTYQALVSNAYRVLESSNAALTVVPLTIITQPTNRMKYSGETTAFNVAAQGAGPFTYQWRHESTDLTDATNTSLTFSNLATSRSGNYSVLVSNAYGSVLSSNALLTVVDSKPIILSQPASRGGYPGGSASFQVIADGSRPLTYQWQFNGANIQDATNTTLLLTNLATTNVGAYSVIVSNFVDSTVSSNALLTLLSIVTWGSTNNYALGTVPFDLTNVLAIAAGDSHSVALKSNGKVVAWGNNFSGQTNVPASLSNVVAIAAGYNHSVALRSNGTVVAWGTWGTNVPSGLTNVIAVAAGDFHSAALKADGTIAVWSDYLYISSGVTNVPADATNVIAIAAGGSFTAALKADGKVFSWGSGSPIYPAGMTNVVAISANEFPLVALKADGKVVVTGVTVPPAGLSNVVSVAAGRYHALALKSNGAVTNWTFNNPPLTPPGLTNVLAIASGQNHCLAIIAIGQPMPQAPMTSPKWKTNSFSFSLPTQSGRAYAAEYKNSLSDTNWTALPLTPGNGGKSILTDTRATNSQRFYRVRQW